MTLRDSLAATDSASGVATTTKNYIVEFHEHEFEEVFDNGIYHFRFFYYNPWDWLLNLVSDPTLADDMVWYPSCKYLVVDGNRQCLRNKFCNSDKWWNMQYSTSCTWNTTLSLPLLVWLNKGWVSSHTNMPSTLRTFIWDMFPEEPLRDDREDLLQIQLFRCIYLHYTSLENWTDCCNVLRCNLSFQANHEEHFDLPPPFQENRGITLVQLFKKSSWRPKTLWENCRILKDGQTIFILPQYWSVVLTWLIALGATRQIEHFIQRM
ncbi:hypothetical protein B0H17DRAFT_1149958 [Mycena rosella]|uniref:Uncharacterized protein n=1 Tax=Mycena rosella TaxID=1033263 RepID=A0AAD7BVW9_MYCRO|nr:hypothetical protein B0H17DRAFT_1149958 [Mycena rosella]